MGQDVNGEPKDPRATRAFTRALLRDLRALECMLSDGRVEAGVRRIGAEQEMFLVNGGWRPAPIALHLLDRLGASGPYAAELGLFNLEANLEPMVLDACCLSGLQARLEELVDGARLAARELGADVALMGILPTLTKSDVAIENITPKSRYYALDAALSEIRGGAPYTLRIDGAEELHLEHESVMLEACNTSFQVHLQVDPDRFSQAYNVAQLVTAPVMAAAVNSPLLFGKHLWEETRIALFQQSIDTRRGSLHMRELSPRVRFGEAWVDASVIELFEEDIARFRVLLTRAVDEDPFAVLAAGGTPELQALQLHNSTIYRWNRPCYGITNGRAHLRIECRVLPSGPSIPDEVANAAFWVGLVLGGTEELGDVRSRIAFEDARANFLAAARDGLGSGFRWLDGRTVGARELILEECLPVARTGLTRSGVAADDADRYLGIVRERVETGRTGARWILESLQGMRPHGTRAEWLAAVTAASVARQKGGRPCHTWAPAEARESGGERLSYLRVEQFMTTSLFTVHEDELVDMVAFLMDRKQIRHVLVEDDAHALVGLVSYRSVLRLMAEGFANGDDAPAVKSIMERDPVTVGPETSTLNAIDLMRTRRVSCLPVVSDGRLVGIVSERDFLPIAYELLEERLGRA